MELYCPLCRIRPLTPDDAPALARAADNQNVRRALRDGVIPRPYRAEDAVEWIKKGNEAPQPSHFAIETDGAFAGVIGHHPPRPQMVELGFWLAEEQWGKGIATAATELFTSHLFAAYPVAAITAKVYEFNQASIRVLEKNGFRLVGWLAAEKEGRRVQELIYAKAR